MTSEAIRRDLVAQRRQLRADPGAGVPRGPARRGVRTGPSCGFGSTRAGGRAHLDLVWAAPGRSSRDPAELADEPDGDRRRALAAVGARRRRAARRRGLVRARPACASCTSSASSAAGDRRAGGAPRAPREPTRILRLRPVRRQRGQRRTLDDRLLEELAYTVFDTETTGPRPVRRATRSSRSARPASSTASCCAASASTSWSIRGAAFPRRRSRSTASGRRWSRPADDRRGPAGVSTPSRATRCWSGTTWPSTCAS